MTCRLIFFATSVFWGTACGPKDATGESSATSATDASDTTDTSETTGTGTATATTSSGSESSGTINDVPVDDTILVQLDGELDPMELGGKGFFVFLYRGCPGITTPTQTVEESYIPMADIEEILALETRWSDLPDAGPDCAPEYWVYALDDWSDSTDFCAYYEGKSPRVTPSTAPELTIVPLTLKPTDCGPLLPN